MNDRPKASGDILENTDRVVVTRWRIPVGAEMGWHKHALDYVVVYLTSARLKVETRTGEEKPLDIPQGASYLRKAGTEHNIVNAGDAEVMFLEVELK